MESKSPKGLNMNNPSPDIYRDNPGITKEKKEKGASAAVEKVNGDPCTAIENKRK